VEDFVDKYLPGDSPLVHFFNQLDRTLFLENEYKELAGHDQPLPIGHGQTISQPTLVYQMTHLLDVTNKSRVLEIGTGSGYQTAFLAEFAAEVYTVERISALSVQAQERLAKLGYTNVQYKIGDGSEGWSEFAPYDRIIVTAGAGKLPESLVEQLNPEGRMLIPVGKKGVQELLLIRKDGTGKVTRDSIDRVTFVELQGIYGWQN
jgi:protein-L-isoaspartate(D-aspartate) O-methyltransferase